MGKTRYLALAGVLVAVLLGAYVLVESTEPDAAGAGLGAGVSAVDVAPAAGAAPQVGQQAPDFTAASLDEVEVSLAQLRGRPVWLTFGATWCASCRVEAPDIQAAHEQAPGAEVMAVYLSEDAAAVRPYVERLGMTFTHVPDPDAAVSATYHVMGVPTHYFIDADGVVRSVRVGVLSRAEMDAALQAISG